MSVFDIMGPVMIGPSSSHTAGAVNIGRIARQVLSVKPASALITLYGSFAATYRGHGTDRALVAGILGYTADDYRVKDALRDASEEGIAIEFKIDNENYHYHPNTARIKLSGEGISSEIVGVSIGGGRIRIREVDNFEVDISGTYNTLLCSYPEQIGVIARVSKILADERINIATMSVSRDELRKNALMVAEVDNELTKETVARIAKSFQFYSVKAVKKIEL